MSILSFEQYKGFYKKYGRTVDCIGISLILNDEELKAMYDVFICPLKNVEKDNVMKQNCNNGKTFKTLDDLHIDGVNKLLDEASDVVKDELTKAQVNIKKVGESLIKFLIAKNKNYGNSALEPMEVFSKHIVTSSPLSDKGRAFNQMLTRLDDKLSRVDNAPCLRKNDVADILGYLILICVNCGWDSFDELID